MLEEAPEPMEFVAAPDVGDEVLDINDGPQSAPETLIGLFCLKYALSERAMAALTELLRLNLDVSKIGDINDILTAMGTVPFSVHTACRNCYADLTAGGCFDFWYVDTKCIVTLF